jgi:tagatose-6-phosphate ketose/aldose isomerase
MKRNQIKDFIYKNNKTKDLTLIFVSLGSLVNTTFMTHLGLGLPVLEEKGAVHTAREISQQPELWQNVWKEVRGQKADLQSYFQKVLPCTKRIIMTGAGTSAFIGLSLRGVWQRRTGILTEAIATTDLVSHPRDYFQPEVPTLLISFARSGNSPESVAAISLADELCKTCYHLVITCNAEGKLAQHGDRENRFVLVLPPEANDQSLAMTSSYTGMLLSGILVSNVEELEGAKRSVDILSGYGRKLIDYYSPELAKIASLNFTRAVFLGSGPFFGTAKESHLKLQELTDGKIICKEDSFLGFRHGPKAVIDNTTLVVYIFSNVDYVSKYERDLVKSMKKGRSPLAEIGIMENRLPGVHLDHIFYLSDNGGSLTEEFLSVCAVLPAQMLGFYKSLSLGLRPDAPSETGAITRVVEGVQIYDLGLS